MTKLLIILEKYTQEPKTLEEQLETYSYWALRKREQGDLKAALRFEKWSKQAEQKLNAHKCACCGILLTATTGPTGPECSGHTEKFPCRGNGGNRLR